jgi:uncharacterized protein YjbJ (UPF0337 family)
MVNTQVLQGQWTQVRGQLKKKWGQLTDDDLRFANGNLDQLIGKIQQKTGEGRDAVEGFLDELTSQGASAVAHATEAAGQYARQAVEGARDGINRVSEGAREGYNRISGEFERGYDVSREFVRHNPARSVGTAFGVGVLLGVVVGLALRSR